MPACSSDYEIHIIILAPLSTFFFFLEIVMQDYGVFSYILEMFSLRPSLQRVVPIADYYLRGMASCFEAMGMRTVVTNFLKTIFYPI